MKYKVFNEKIILRLNRGEEVLESIKKVCAEEKIQSAAISAIGAADKVTVGLYEVEKREYKSNTFNKEMEITNISGNVSSKDGEIYLHLHGTFADENGCCIGGHLNEAVISGTCEIIINIIKGKIDRIFDGETGLFVMDF